MCYSVNWIHHILERPMLTSGFSVFLNSKTPNDTVIWRFRRIYKPAMKFWPGSANVGYCSLPGRDVYFVVPIEIENGRDLIRFDGQCRCIYDVGEDA